MDRPKSTKYYKPLERPKRYPLELTRELHICLWDITGKYKWTIALWNKTKEGYDLAFVGSRPLDERVNWGHLEEIVRQGQYIADRKWDREGEGR